MARFTLGARDLVWYAARCPDLVFVRTTRDGTRVYQFTCPVEAHGDRNPSGLLFRHRDGQIVPHCGSRGCPHRDIMAALEQVPPAEQPHDPDAGGTPQRPYHPKDDDGPAAPRKRGRGADPDFAGRRPYSDEDLEILAAQIEWLNGHSRRGHSQNGSASGPDEDTHDEHAPGDDHAHDGNEDDGAQGEAHLNPALPWLARYAGVSLAFLETQPLRAVYYNGLPAIAFDHAGSPRVKVRIVGTSSHAGSRWDQEEGNVPHLWPTPQGPLPSTIYICESYTDALAVRSLGLLAFAVANGAAATIPVHIWRALKRLGVEEIVAVYDIDKAGVEGAAHLLASAAESEITGTALDLFPYLDPFQGEKDMVDALRRHGADMKDKLVPEKRRSRLPHRTMPEIVTDSRAPDDWLVPNILPRTGLTILTGDSGIGKLDVEMLLFDSASTGAPLFGNPVAPFPVVFMSEDNEAVLRNRSKPYNAKVWHNVHVVTLDNAMALGLDWTAKVDEALALCRETGAKLCVWDTALKWCDLEDANSQTEVAALMLQLRRLSRHGISCVLVTHDRKSGGNHGQQVAGSVQWQADAQMLFDLQRTDDDCVRKLVLERKRLNVAPGHTGPYFLRKDDEDSPLVWQEQAPDEVKEAELRHNIINFIREKGPDGASVADVMQYTTLSRPSVSDRLKEWCKKRWGLLYRKPGTGTNARDKTNPLRYCCTLDLDPDELLHRTPDGNAPDDDDDGGPVVTDAATGIVRAWLRQCGSDGTTVQETVAHANSQRGTAQKKATIRTVRRRLRRLVDEGVARVERQTIHEEGCGSYVDRFFIAEGA